MLLGFGMASVFERAPARRNTILLAAGAASPPVSVSSARGESTAIRIRGKRSRPGPWPRNRLPERDKYPPSLLFLMMTLGPAAILCAVADRISGGVLGVVKDA